MKNYKMNFATATLTITKDFSERLENPNSDECMILEHLMKVCPNLQIRQRTANRKAPSKNKGLTFEKMEKYISLHENADELLSLFEKIKDVGDTHSNKYGYVSKWFHKQFPQYKELPTIVDGKIKAVALTDVEIEEETEELAA